MENVTNNFYLKEVNWRKLIYTHISAYVAGMGTMWYLLVM